MEIFFQVPYTYNRWKELGETQTWGRDNCRVNFSRIPRLQNTPFPYLQPLRKLRTLFGFPENVRILPSQPGTVHKPPFSLCKLIVNLLSFKYSEKRNYPSSQVEYLYPTLSEWIYSKEFTSVRCIAKSTEWEKSNCIQFYTLIYATPTS